jgi:anti-sigma B factor antagonist
MPLADSLRPRGPVQLTVIQEERPGRTIIRAEGEVDVMTAPKLSAYLDSVLRSRDTDVAVDLTETTFLDSAGLHVLLNAARRLTRRSRRLIVVCAPGPVRHVIELARLAETLGVSDPEALTA